jgi:RHS repeat-associated protein
MAAGAAVAQPLPDTQHGFPPNATFATSGIDSVNLFNGNVVLNIPIGPDYPIGAGLSSQLRLVYNSQIWTTTWTCADATNDWYGVYVRGYPQLGAGWRLDFGYTHQDPEATKFNFHAPGGSSHEIPTLGPPNNVSSDLSFLNFNVANEVGYPNGDRATLGAAIDEGQIQHGHTPNDFLADGQYVTKVRTRFGDYVKITYAANPNRIDRIEHFRNGAATALRTITFTYKTLGVAAPSAPTFNWTVIDKITFPREGGSTQVVVFDYFTTGFFRSPYDNTNLGCGPAGSPTTVSAPLLKKVTLDQTFSSTAYEFKYWDTDTDTPANGSLFELKLPTGGVVQYQYGDLIPQAPLAPEALASGGCPKGQAGCDFAFRRKNIVAITQRTEYPNGTGASNVWTYTRDRTGSDPDFVRTVEVGAPDGSSTVHSFHDEPDATAFRQSTGLEFEIETFDPTGTNPVRQETLCYESNVIGGVCASNGLWQLSKNIRETQRKISILNSSGAVVKSKGVLRSGWDGYGHFGQEDFKDWGGTLRRKGVTTTWTPNMTDWILSLFTRRVETQYVAGATVVESEVDRRYQFDTTTGFQKGYAIYDPGPSPDRKWVNCRYPDPGSPGDVQKEGFATLDSDGPPPAAFCPANLPAEIGTNSDAFGKKYAYLNGQVTQTNWLQTPNGSIGWFSFDVDRAAEDGAITDSRDTAGWATSYSYDKLGRLTVVSPPDGELSTFVCYDADNKAATAYRATGPQSPCPANAATSNTGPIKTWERFLYDGFGRLTREIRQLDAGDPLVVGDGSFAVRKHTFNNMGLESSTSEWGLCSSLASCGTASPPSTTRSNYDPFGRPQRIVGPGNSSILDIDRTDGTGLYSDTVEKATGCVNGTWNGSACIDIPSFAVTHTSPQTTNRRDAFGRITSVTEHTGDVTYYAYDADDKLNCVKQGGTPVMTECTSNPGGQYRRFTHDPFGYLREEVTPEKGTVSMSGLLPNGSGKYGALGNLREKVEGGGNTVSYLYDAAGRVLCEFAGQLPNGVTTCTDTLIASNVKFVRNFYDGAGSGGGASPEAKLTRRIATNPSFEPLAPAGTASQVIQEDFVYDGRAGRLSSKSLSMETGAVHGAAETWAYDTLGLLQTHTHPRVQISTGAPGSLTESYIYKFGLPIQIDLSGKDYLNASIPTAKVTATYRPAGNLETYTGQQGTGTILTTTITSDTSGLPRPQQIQTKWGATTVFLTNGMVYDASGNVSKVGADFYTYDSLSRVKRGSLSGAGDQYFCYDRYGNRTAKGTSQPSCSAVWLDNRVPPGTTNYDSRGNQTVNTPENMAYDAVNRMTKDSGTSGGTWQYLYDAADERLVRVPLGSGIFSVTRRGVARFIVQAKVQAGAWTLPTTPCAEATRRFSDVHCADPDWAYIEVFASKNITSGCGSGMYCPETVVTRDQMAVFLLKTLNGGSYTPATCTPPGSFTDVPCPSHPFANAIYDALARGLTSGCGGSNYCPSQAVNETAMATFLNKPALLLTAYRGIQGGSYYTVRDESNRLVTEFADGFPSRDNVFLGNLLVASYVSKTPSNPNPSWQFHGSDHLGTVRVSVNASNGATEAHKYWPYGDEVGASPPPLTQRLAFAAMERDTETTHFYDHARTQDFGLGRFGSPDKLGGRTRDPQSWNRFAYGRNNPLKYLDPNGLAAVGFTGLGNNPGGITQIVRQVDGAPGIGRARTFGHQDVDRAVKFLADQHRANPNEATVIFGHSLGSASTLKAAKKLGQQGIKVDLVVTIDPVFFDRTVSPNVSQAYNYYESTDDLLPGRQVTAESATTAMSNSEVQGVSHTEIDDVLSAFGTVATQILDVGVQYAPPPAPTCGDPKFIGPCPR